MKRYFHDIEIALEALRSNKLKSSLTALGILFGVAAVISMLAIGQGAKQEILKQIELIGANNIIVEAKIDKGSSGDGEDEEEQGDQKEKQRKFSPGLDKKDYEAIRTILPNVQGASPEVIMQSGIIYKGTSMEGKCIGVSNAYFDIYNFSLVRGSYFSPIQEEEGKKVCIIGSDVASRLFSQENPVGDYIKFGNIWLKVIGVLRNEAVSASTLQEYGFNNVNNSIYIPDKTMIMRIKNRKILNYKPSSSAPEGAVVVVNGAVYGGQSGEEQNNYHQLDRIVIKVANTDHLETTAGVVKRMLTRRHNGMQDFEVIVPEILLRQKQQAKEIFNLVLGAIAGISLLVGGIGIMNIMFATVMERIKEIGIRMSIGANKKDILIQFMSEAVMISLAGGFTGIALGIGISGTIEQLTEIETVVTPGSILIAFLVSVTVGIIFGYSPAKRAAEKDPIESLRYE